MKQANHVLVVGGTGMLRGVSLHFALRQSTISVIARGRLRLEHLAEESRRLGGQFNPIAVDYRDDASLRKKLEEARRVFGPICLAIGWIHSIAPGAPYVVGECIGREPPISRYFDVLSSAAEDPCEPEPDREAHFRKFPHLLYRRIVLGFLVERNSSRWLTERGDLRRDCARRPHRSTPLGCRSGTTVVRTSIARNPSHYRPSREARMIRKCLANRISSAENRAILARISSLTSA